MQLREILLLSLAFGDVEGSNLLGSFFSIGWLLTKISGQDRFGLTSDERFEKATDFFSLQLTFRYLTIGTRRSGHQPFLLFLCGSHDTDLRAIIMKFGV